jgi:hypothetical protein
LKKLKDANEKAKVYTPHLKVVLQYKIQNAKSVTACSQGQKNNSQIPNSKFPIPS